VRIQSNVQAGFRRVSVAGESGLLAALVLLAALLPATACAERRDRSGSEVVATVCSSCHAAGVNGAPRIGDNKAWASRASQGLSALTGHALQGIRKMPAHGGNLSLSDIEIERAITRMVNLSGGHWTEPLDASAPAAVRTGEQVVQQTCSHCHQDGLQGAPKIGDRAAWIQRFKVGLDTLVRSAVHGHGGMPPRGGTADLSDDEIRSAILYMFNYGVAMPPAAHP
jgi:cytochrome c5